MSQLHPDPQPYPLYNTTYTLHRLSPLHISTSLPLNTAILQHHARRFREILVGDVLRGVRVGLENDAITTAGALQKVTWRLLPEEDAWDMIQDESETRLDETTVTIDSSRGILVTVEYERSTYTGLLLKRGGELEDGFQHFPLLMTKMPGSLREAFVDFLSTTFDTRVSGLLLSNSHITDAFEKYLVDIGVTEDGEELDPGEKSRLLRNIVKEAEVFVGFDLPGGSGALKTIEIHLMREDIPRLLASGKKIGGPGNPPPFMEALSTYIQGHLALDLKNERVRIIKIACGAFVIGVEGKIKLTEPINETESEQQYRATRGLVDGLIQFAAGGNLLQQVP